MGREYDARQYDPNKEAGLIPDGWHPFRVMDFTEGQSLKGNHYQVVAKCKCIDPNIDPALRDDVEVWHFVTFLPATQKGAGMALHWLSVMGEPHEGQFKIVPEKWIGKTFMAKTAVNEYKDKEDKTRRNNKFVSISPIKDESAKVEEETPF